MLGADCHLQPSTYGGDTCEEKVRKACIEQAREAVGCDSSTCELNELRLIFGATVASLLRSIEAGLIFWRESRMDTSPNAPRLSLAMDSVALPR
ncbi:hypothetical protein RFN28_01600 [Mesorhizobium sp. VK24D]|uniref:Uncharacterized protein n=1 Tax=Mesorhizobium album TaxID=3072314 RepID=A0ABU4XR11_9HYPH|nr:hypothetical protein [Mesorhizobium sp. VK24D]MDX8477167.1 hypothetical protein [Mesorhizobium sp. VK24D]